ncbi:hypothetical protein [Pontibacter harenae]|uniref:hypothetical protein n=1 Tax=Pontibacter harenae TaxID=2894083 RepID=UPI001E33D846|nr:hypothetical protein [Pontibacter harenae]MCC9166980.1 hypothetical protein [Pontibacter harenae]
MMKFWRSFFGVVDDSPTNRTVIGKSAAGVDPKDVKYIKASNARLALLHNLLNRYKGTSHEAKIKEVYDKTSNIHAYLISKRRIHDLELFHLQNTEHFINAFKAILDAHERHVTITAVPAEPEEVKEPVADKNTPPKAVPKPDNIFTRLEAEAENLIKRFENEVFQGNGKTYSVPEPDRHVKRQAATAPTATVRTQVPSLALPNVAIDTYSKVHYERASTADGVLSGEICFTSAEQEKENFLQAIAPKLGVYKTDLSYVGNTMLVLPNSHGLTPAAYVPVVRLKGCPYAVDLINYRLFPVKMQSRGL